MPACRPRRPNSATSGKRRGREAVLQKLRFNDEVVVVTGAAGGIGRATVEALAELGATTVLVGRTQAKPEEVKAALGKAGAKSEAFAADVSNEADVARLRDFVRQTWGRAKAVVNNAGNNFISPIADLSTQKWHELIAVDLDSIFYMCRAFIPLLLETKNPSILNVASTFAHIGNPHMPVYCAAKGGVVSLTRQLAVDYGEKGLSVNSLCPGPTLSPRVKGYFDSGKADPKPIVQKTCCNGLRSARRSATSPRSWSRTPPPTSTALRSWSTAARHQLSARDDPECSPVTDVLKGVRVVELSTVITAPLAGMMLADLGADVIKVEHPQGGDPFRTFRGEQYSPNFVAYNRGKRSIQLDLRADAGRSILLKLVARADVLLENYRPGIMEKLGLGDDVLTAANARLIHCSITGFGASGPYSARPAYDNVAVALSGIASLQLDAEQPQSSGPTIPDNATGMFACYGILGALYERARSGRGHRVDVNMLEAGIAFIPDPFAN